MEDVLSRFDHKTQSLHTELIEIIGKTQIEFQTVDLALDGQNKELHDELTTLKSDFNQMHIERWAETLEKIEAGRHECRSQLEQVRARTVHGKGNRKQCKHGKAPEV
jgi:hypothetical protein